MLIKVDDEVLLALQLPLQLGRQHEAHGPFLGLGGWVLLHSTIRRIFRLIVRTINRQPYKVRQTARTVRKRYLGPQAVGQKSSAGVLC